MANRHFLIQQCSFEDVLPYWREKLWPGRVSAIEPASIIGPSGDLNLRMEILKPQFFCARSNEDGRIIGVNSGFLTSQELFRSRGLWVAEEHRKAGVGSALVQALEFPAHTLGARRLWTMPRLSAQGFYLRQDFRVEGQTDRYEFGPHLLMFKTIQRMEPHTSPAE